MGSQAMQSKYWGQRPKDWAEIQEPTGREGYEYALNNLSLLPSTKLLDIGCGTGYFCNLAKSKGIGNITGFDATAEFIAVAKKRVPSAVFINGEMEVLPFEDESFDIVCGFNSIQYAADTRNALLEAERVLIKGGTLVTMIWGNHEDCEATSYLKALGSLLPPPPPGTPGPFALTENHLLEKILTEMGFTILSVKDVTSIWDYPDKETALKGLLSAGPAAIAIEHNGYEKVYDTVSMAVLPYMHLNGRVLYNNKWRVVISKK